MELLQLQSGYQSTQMCPHTETSRLCGVPANTAHEIQITFTPCTSLFGAPCTEAHGKAAVTRLTCFHYQFSWIMYGIRKHEQKNDIFALSAYQYILNYILWTSLVLTGVVKCPFLHFSPRRDLAMIRII